MIVLDGTSMTCADVAAVGRRLAGVEIGAAGWRRASSAAETARALTEQALAAGRAVYGRTTGVGFNRSIEGIPEDGRSVGLRLGPSHATRARPPPAAGGGLALPAGRATPHA